MSASDSDQSSCSLINTLSAWLILINVARIELESLKSQWVSFVARDLFIGFMMIMKSLVMVRALSQSARGHSQDL